jgi:hypothetical protein
MYAYNELPFTFTALYGALKGSRRAPADVGMKVLARDGRDDRADLLMGATFPFLVRAGAGDSLAIGRPVGRIYGTNTLGAILGAALGSLLLLPWLYIAVRAVRGVTQPWPWRSLR